MGEVKFSGIFMVLVATKEDPKVPYEGLSTGARIVLLSTGIVE